MILQLASKYVRGVLVAFAIIALIRGHNYPGGGFIGGMLAGLSIAYRGFAYTSEKAVEMSRFYPRTFCILGFSCVVASTLISVLSGQGFMKGMWWKFSLAGTQIKLGSPFLFDIGVFMVVVGVTVIFLFSLKRQNLWK